MSKNSHHLFPLGYRPASKAGQSWSNIWKRRWRLFALGVIVGAAISTPIWLGMRGMVLFWIVWAVLGVECTLGAYFLETPNRKAIGLGILVSIPILLAIVVFFEVFTLLRRL